MQPLKNKQKNSSSPWAKVHFRKDKLVFSRCRPNFGLCFTFLEIRETNLEAVFCVFQQFSGSPRFRAYKNGHNLQPGALKVTKSVFLDEKCVSFVSLVERWEKIWSKS